MRIAVDAMGGDLAPAEIVAGVLAAAARWTDTEFILVGDQDAIRTQFGHQPQRVNIAVHHAPDVIGMEDDPARAVRRKPNSSLVQACRLVAEGSAEAIFSAGNTGAAAAAALFTIGRLDGVQRPAIAVVLPARSESGKVIVCDAGANVDCKPEWLAQFATMGAMYAEGIEGITNPRVGLLNIGEETCKGNALSKAAHALLENAGHNWVGNVEAKAVMRGIADVITCDGFDGNLVLKVAESTAEYTMSMLKDAFGSSLMAKLGGLLARSSLRGLKRKVDYTEYGGAVLLGIKGLVIIGHGCSPANAVVAALGRARTGLQNGLVSRMADHFAAIQAA
ncbi:MAG TPA: phosphate acyltransferase PlsX [Armatimonadetes bacterium]|nr:phosphate acyltransferase PlsX [Armatimonadota bacterium]